MTAACSQYVTTERPGPASLQLVPPDYYSAAPRYRAYVVPARKTKQGRRMPQTIVIEREVPPLPAEALLENRRQIIDMLNAAQGGVRAARGEMTNKGFGEAR